MIPPSPSLSGGLAPTQVRERLARACGPDEVVSPYPARPGRALPGSLEQGLLEPRKGYRFRPENLLLQDLLSPGPRSVVDLGCGTGSLLLAALYLLAPERACGVEIQPEMVDRLRRTLDAHGLAPVPVVQGDLREGAVVDLLRQHLGGGADLVLANPPFFPVEWGRPSSRESTRRSTHAEAGGVREFLAAGRDLLSPEGRILLLFDAGRLMEALAVASDLGLGLHQVHWCDDGASGRPFRTWLLLGPEGLLARRMG